MDFEEYRKLKDSGMSRRQIRMIESAVNKNQLPFSHVEWQNFMKSFIPFVKYIGPNRFEMMIENFRQKNFSMSAFMDYVDPTGREGSNEPYLRIQNGAIVYYDTLSTNLHESVSGLHRNAVNEDNIFAFLMRSILKSIISQVKIFTSSVVSGLFGKFKFNPETDEERQINDALVYQNNVLCATDYLKVKYAIWGRDIIDRIKNKSNIPDNDRSVTWVKECKPIHYNLVKPIGHDVLNVNRPWNNTVNPNFDVALEYICCNFGAKVLCDSLLDAYNAG